MGPRERRARERGEIRTRILDAARDLFVSEGFDAVTMRRIAEKIEYSATAIYFHFRDKESLLHELCDHDFRALAQEFMQLAEVSDPIERLRKTGHAYINFGLNYPNHYRLMFMTPHPPTLAGESDVTRGNPEEDAYAFLKLMVSQAIEEGRFRAEYKDIDLVSQIVWAGVHGVISLEIAKCHDEWVDWRPLADRAQLMVDVLIDGLQRQEK